MLFSSRLRAFVASLAYLSMPLAASAASLLHSYDFASGVTDSVGGADGSLLNGASVTGHALTLDGVDDYVQFDTKIVPTSGSYSVTFWVNETARSGTYMEVISQGSTSGPGFYIGHDPAGNLRVADQFGVQAVSFGTLGSWMQYALTVDTTAGTRLYRNGAQVFSSASALVSTTGGTATRLGRQFAPYSEFLTGSIDDLQIYSGALQVNEVAALYAQGHSVGAVPEPASAGLILVGLLGVGGLVRYRASAR